MLKDIWRVIDMKFREDLIYKDIYVENLKLGIITDVVLDAEEWKLTHLEVKLTKEASKEILGAKESFKNLLAISAVGPASKSITSKNRIDIQVSKGQLRMYLTPP